MVIILFAIHLIIHVLIAFVKKNVPLVANNRMVFGGRGLFGSNVTRNLKNIKFIERLINFAII